MTAVVIMDRTGPVPVFFSLSVGKQIGNRAGGWGEREKALRFADADSAQQFIDAFLVGVPQAEPFSVD